jgi:mannose-6-phosphate isomerase-like protein (cupin superfamily)
MERRSLLRAAAGVVPALALHDLMAGAAHAQAPESGLHVVGAGEDRSGSPHPMGMSTMYFKVSGSETGGGLFVIEHQHLIPGGPPLHQHWNQEEWFFVMEGEMAFQVGEQRIHLKAGESVLAPRRVPHTFSAVSATPARMMIAFCPAGKMEQYFCDAAHPPAGVSDAEFLRRYEMDWVGPNPFMKT